MSFEVVEVDGRRVAFDREMRRLVVLGHVPVYALAADGPLARLWRDVCGPDAEIAAGVGNLAGVLAVCAAGEAETWMAELLGGGES